MKAARYAVVIAWAMSAVLAGRAAESAGPEPGDVIYPRTESANAESGASDDSSLVPGPSLGGVFPTLGYLVAIGLLGAGGWYVIKRGSLPRPFAKSDGKLRVLETRLLGNRQFLVVAEYEDAKMLLGVCPGRIDYLTPLVGHPLSGDAEAESETPATPRPVAMELAAQR